MAAASKSHPRWWRSSLFVIRSMILPRILVYAGHMPLVECPAGGKTFLRHSDLGVLSDDAPCRLRPPKRRRRPHVETPPEGCPHDRAGAVGMAVVEAEAGPLRSRGSRRGERGEID